MSASSLSSSSSMASAAWAELPPDIMENILQRLGQIEILQNVQRVCTAWWKASHNPILWRVIDLKNDDPNNFMTPQVLEQICRVMVHRSQGGLLKIGIENFGNLDLLNYIAQRCSRLRHLRLVRCYNNFVGGFTAAAENFPLLEKLDIYSTSITKYDVESVGLSCPRLESLILDDSSFDSQDNDRALAIAKTMPNLRHLQFRANSLTFEALQAIFEGCPHLESPDLGLF